MLCSMGLPGFIAAPLYSKWPGWRGLYIDGGLRHMLTPLESRADVTVRTLSNPLKAIFRWKLRRHRGAMSWSEHNVIKPPFRLGPRQLLWPPSMLDVYEMMEHGRTAAAQSPAMALAVLAPFRRDNLAV